MKVWSWRQAIAKTPLQSTTKLVLYTLANYMNDHGTGCYPSIETIALESGLSKRAVITHTENAVKAGFLKRSKHGYAGQEWARNEYQACYPEGSELRAPSLAEGNAPDAPPLMKGSELRAPRIKKGSANEGKKVVHHVHTNSPLNSPVVIDDDSSASERNSIQDIFHYLEKLFRSPDIFYITAPIEAWINWGADFEKDIRPVAESYKTKHPDKPPRSLAFLDDRIAASIKQRNKPMPEMQEMQRHESDKPIGQRKLSAHDNFVLGANEWIASKGIN